MANIFTAPIEDPMILNPTIEGQGYLESGPSLPQDDSFLGRLQRGIRMDFPNAGVRDSRKPYPMMERTQTGSGAAPGDLLPAEAPAIPGSAPSSPAPRNYLAEVENSQRGFNADRDTPQPNAAQAAYTPPMRADRSAVNSGPEPSGPSLNVLKMLRQDASAGKYSDSMGSLKEYEKNLSEQIKTMLPGASPKEMRSILNTITRTTSSGSTTGSTGAPMLGDTVNKALTPGPSYQKLGPGQSIYQMLPDGSAKLVTTAPDRANASSQKNPQFDAAKNVRNDYAKSWDGISKNTEMDAMTKHQAYRDLNRNYFGSMGIPVELADVPVSFKVFTDEKMLKNKIAQPTDEMMAEWKAIHKNLIKTRNQMLKQYWGGQVNYKSGFAGE